MCQYDIMTMAIKLVHCVLKNLKIGNTIKSAKKWNRCVYCKVERSYVKQYTTSEDVVYHRLGQALCRVLQTLVILLFIAEKLGCMFPDGLSRVFWITKWTGLL